MFGRFANRSRLLLPKYIYSIICPPSSTMGVSYYGINSTIFPRPIILQVYSDLVVPLWSRDVFCFSRQDHGLQLTALDFVSCSVHCYLVLFYDVFVLQISAHRSTKLDAPLHTNADVIYEKHTNFTLIPPLGGVERYSLGLATTFPEYIGGAYGCHMTLF